jgi:hypothetical protein
VEEVNLCASGFSVPTAFSVPTVAGVTCCSIPTSFLCQRPSSRPVLFGTYADGSDKKAIGIGFGRRHLVALMEVGEIIMVRIMSQGTTHTCKQSAYILFPKCVVVQHNMYSSKDQTSRHITTQSCNICVRG